MTATTTRPISRAAFLARCRRRLAETWKTLHITRGDRWRSDMGEMYIKNYDNVVIDTHHTYESLQEMLEVLRPGEALPED